jgi:superfamily I DNA/RNA helicase
MSNEAKYKEILNSKAKRICVIAGPGTGKTKGVLIPKTETLLKSGAPPEQILLLSFSRLSALDLKNRVHAKVGASTVHSFCLSFLLSENNHDIRSRLESLVFDFEEQSLICDLKIQFPTVHKNELKQMLKEYKAGWATAQQDSALEHNNDERKFKYAVMNWLKEHRAALLGEIMYSGLELIKHLGRTEFLAKIQYILVDEYQDLNKLEQEFVNKLAEGTELLIAVGDPDQSIYSFKFAHPDGILEFKKASEAHFIEYCARCAKKIVALANQLLLQAMPGRTHLPKSLPECSDGEVNLLRPFENQDQEFQYVFESIAKKLTSGVKPEEILALVPRKGLADQFLKSIDEKKEQVLKSLGASIKLASKSGFSQDERRSVLLFSLAAHPDSLLHMRTYLGLGDDDSFAAEFAEGKEKYGGLEKFIEGANPDDFPSKKLRVRRLCAGIQGLKATIKELEQKNIDEIIDTFFPKDKEALAWINDALRALKEEGDRLETLHRKFTDYVRSAPNKPGIIRVMTLGLSKGLDAEHVFIMSASSGNIPGENYSDHLSDEEFVAEQRRLLYVGMTRAKKSLTITWSRYIPFGQSQTQQTQHTGVRRKAGEEPHVKLTICEFLQGLN